MKSVRILLALSFFLLAAASCGRTPATKIDDLSLATAIQKDNRPETSLTVLPASTKQIYLSGRVLDPAKTTRIRVRWTKLPSSIIASEDFTGSRSKEHSTDFDENRQGSYFASQITKTDLTWPLGDYKVEIFLNGRLAGAVPFKVVSDSESADQQTQNQLKSVKFGDDLNDTLDGIASSKTSFSGNTPHIYIQSDFSSQAVGQEVAVSVRYIRDNLTILSTSTQLTGDPRFLVDLDLDRLGRFWPDHLWPAGIFEVQVRLSDVVVKTATFNISR